MLLGMRDHPRRPFVAVLGGAKVSDKLGVIDALLGIVDSLVVGGAMCFTFLAARGASIGDSLFEPDQVDTCRRLLDSGKAIHLPSDIVAVSPGGQVATYGTRIPDGWKGYDIGPGSAAEFADVIADANTIFWNGPMGVFEDERFVSGTLAIAARGRRTRTASRWLAVATARLRSREFGLADRVDHVSHRRGRIARAARAR